MAKLKPVGIVTAAAVLAASVAGTVAARSGVRIVPRTMFGPAFIHNTTGDNGERVRALQVGGAFQSATYMDERRFEPCFEYYRAFDHVFEASVPIKDMLMIGGGGFAYPKHVMSKRPEEVKMTVVEIDPAIVRIAKRWFYVDELIRRFDLERTGRMKIEVTDGRDFLAAAPSSSFDAILNDSFEGVAPTVGLLSVACLRQAKRVLRPGGIYMVNAVMFEEELPLLNTYMELLGEVFEHVCVIPCVDEEFSGAGNYLVIGSSQEHLFTGTSARRTFESVQEKGRG